jgi:pantoate kinase
MRKAAAFVPGHISGFFQICDEASELERKGSRNCGPCINAGVLTEIAVDPNERLNVEVLINGRRAPEAYTTLAVVRQILPMVPEPSRVIIKHSAQVPIGAGYGASGAGALGAALALSKAFDLGFTRSKMIEIAHVAEVSCRTGLGDVGAQAIGGVVIGLEPGAPPHGKWQQISLERDVKIICATLAPLSTKELLEDIELRDRSRKFGAIAMKNLLKRPTLQNFIKVSNDFSEGLGLLDDELRELIEAANSAGAIGASMVMLGRAVFALVKVTDLGKVKKAFSELVDKDAIVIADLDITGARLF